MCVRVCVIQKYIKEWDIVRIILKSVHRMMEKSHFYNSKNHFETNTQS